MSGTRCARPAFSCLVLLSLCHPITVNAQSFIPHMNITVARHIDMFSAGNPSTQLNNATTLLQTNNGVCGDVRCCIALDLSGTIGTFGFFTGDGYEDITSQEELLAVFNSFQQHNVKVVDSMTDCCNEAGLVAGCTAQGSRINGGNQNSVIAIAVPSFVWAHEFGHAQNIEHYSGCSQLIMSTTFSSARNAVTNAECTTFRASPTYSSGLCAAAPSDLYSYFVLTCSPYCPHFKMPVPAAWSEC